MLYLETRHGIRASVAETLAEETDPRFSLESLDGALAHYREHGYVVLANLIDPADCACIRALWESEIKPYSGPMYRQETGRAVPHVFNERGWVMNAIANIQSVDPRHFPAFRAFARERILSAPGLTRLFSTLLGAPPRIAQSMYFEGNDATPEHRDSYYLDSETIGAMAGAWIALEDIAADAGRFFVCPGSHRLDPGRHQRDNCVIDRHGTYIGSVVESMNVTKLDVRAPVLRSGDVLFWHSLTIHGSLASDDPKGSRSSITCHAIPEGDRLLQYHSRKIALRSMSVNGVQIHAPKDQARLRHRVIRQLECSFPRLFHRLKNAAIRSLVRD